MLRKVRLYGTLAKFVGERVLEADINSAAEAVRFLLVNFPGVEKHMSVRYYMVSADNLELVEEELHYPIGGSDIQVIPVVGGAGRGAGKIILGVALIGIAIATGGAGFGLGGSVGFGTLSGATFWTNAAAFGGNLGIALVLGGVADAITPIPKTPESVQDPQNTFSFSGIQNVSRAGVAVPVLYGQVLTGSVVISAGIDTVQVET